MVSYYFLVHDMMVYFQHGDMICCKIATETEPKQLKPRQLMFRKIRKGDKIVYYAAGSYVILGIFTVKSDMEYYSDKIWPNVFVRKIEPGLLPPKGKYLHIKKLLFESNYTFDVFPNKRLWHTALRGKTLKSLTEADYERFRRSLSESRFLVRKNEIKIPVTTWQRSQGHKQAPIISSPGKKSKDL